MKKITLLFVTLLFTALTWQSNAQHTFAPAGPVNVAGGTPVNISINDAANTAGAPADTYTEFFVSVEWADGFNAWSSEADLTIVTASGSVQIDPATTGSADSGAATTLTFSGSFTEDYDPSVDGTLDLILGQSYTGSDADWSNITVSILSGPPATPDCATTPFPADGATDVPTGNMTLTWSAPASGPTPSAYNVYVYDDAAGTNPGLILTTSTPSADVTVSGFNVEVFWAAIPVNLTEEATGCDVWLFTTQDPPVGAVCEDPIVISTLPYTTSDDTSNYGDDYEDGDSPCDDYYMSGDDVVYSFTPDSNGSFNVSLTDITATWSGIHILDGCPGSSPTCVGFMGNSETTDRVLDVTLSGGTTYFIVISTWAAPQSTEYTLNITENTCTDATVEYNIVSDCDNSEGFYVDVEITDMGSATDITLSDDQGSTPQSTSSTGTYQFGPFVNGTDVVITVTDDNDSNCTQTSSVLTQEACPPANDDISGAIALAVDANYCDGVQNNGTNMGATDSGEGVGSCFFGDNGDNDVWFSVTIPSNVATIDVSTDFTGGTLVDTEIAIYSGTSGNLVEIDCDQDGGTTVLSNGSSYNSLMTDVEVTGGETYIIQVAGYEPDDTGTFCIEVSTNSLGIDSSDLNAFTYFPNPVKNTLNLKAQSTIQNVSVYNMLGQEVLRTAPNSLNSELNMASLQTGAYFVKVTINDATETIRVIKQ